MYSKKNVTIATLVLLVAASSVFLLWKNKPVTINPQEDLDVHRSYFSQLESYEEPLTRVLPQLGPVDGVAGLIVNHHLLVPEFIAQTAMVAATDEPQTILLISPNHFYRGSGRAVTGKWYWETPYGTLETNQSLISELSQRDLVVIDDKAIDEEHGFSAVVPYLKKYLPNATLVPVMVSDGWTTDQIAEWVNKVGATFPKDTLVVGSFDFSHYLPGFVAQLHDEMALQAILGFQYDQVSKLDVDSQVGLEILLRWMEQRKAQEFNKLQQTNSAIVSRTEALETTSYITGYFTPGLAQVGNSNKTITIYGDYVTTKDFSSLWNGNLASPLKYLQRMYLGSDASVIRVRDRGMNKSQHFINLTTQLNMVDVTDAGSDLRWFENQQDLDTYLASVSDASLVVRLDFIPSQLQLEELHKLGIRLLITPGKIASVSYSNSMVVVAGLNDQLRPGQLPSSSLGLHLSCDSQECSLTFLPLTSAGGQLQLMYGKSRDTLLVSIARRSNVSPEMVSQISRGAITWSIKK